jgi:putative DNA primase/helicase
MARVTLGKSIDRDRGSEEINMTTAAEIAERLGLTESGDGYSGICPCCCYERAFSVVERDGRLLFHCHVGCTQAEVIQGLREWEVWGSPSSQGGEFPPGPVTNHPPESKTSRDNALAMWARSQPAEGTVVEKYLRARGYNGPIPAALRYVSGKHPSDEQLHPVMVAAAIVIDPPEIIGVHRTFLRADGSGKAPLDPNKMSLGDVRGACVPLTRSRVGQTVAVSEGIETGLSVQQATDIPTLAALSTGGLKALLLPSVVRDVRIAADPDKPGLEAAQAAARRWHAEGRKVCIVRPPEGQDFNDLARSRL